MKKIVYLVVLSVLLISCKSIPNGKGDFTGIVIDEKNQPVDEFVMYCYDKNGNKVGTELTDENGIFVFYDLNYGKYEISGQKFGYSIIEKEDYTFRKPSDFCVCQVMSWTEAVRLFYSLFDRDREEARRIIGSIYKGDE